MKNICVFCGSQNGARPEYAASATAFGAALGRRGLGMVYGGGRVGLMGLAADALLEQGGHVLGIIPGPLASEEIAHRDVTELRVVPDMHTRKLMMHEESDALVALPGGYGTFEEVLEAIAWSKLGIHGKPVGILNVSGFYDPLLAMIDRAVDDGFIGATYRGLFVTATEADALLDAMEAFEQPEVRAWP